MTDAMSDPRDASGYSSADLISMGFLSTPSLAALVENTKNISQLSLAHFDAIVVAGGQAPMFNFEKATQLHSKFVEFYEAGKIACALCHGVSILRYAKLSNGKLLAAGKTVTGFANVEEDFADNAVWNKNLLPRGKNLMPWRIDDEMREIGANFIQAGLWKGFAVRDGNLVIGHSTSGAEILQQLVQDVGFDAMDVGPLETARLLEPAALLWIASAYKFGMGREFAFARIKRETN